MHLSLLETRPFNKFVEMELERDNLYNSFTTLDEPKEISEAWIVFAESCSRNLSTINSLADMAVQRIHDVYLDSLKDGNNPLALHHLLYGDFKNQLMALNNFELHLGIMTYVYSQVRNRGVFSFEPKTTQYTYYITAKESIDRILYRLLNNEIPEVENESYTPASKIDDLLSILMPLVQLENLKRLLPVYDSIPGSDKDPKTLTTKGEYDYLQGITLLTHIINIARKASQDFWWADPISELSILNHAKEHFETVINLWNQMPEYLGNRALSIQSEFLPIVEAHSSISLVQHFRLLAQNALESGELSHARNYFNKALKEFNKACKYLKEAETPESEFIFQSIQKEEIEIQIFHSLTHLAILYNSAVDALYKQDTETALQHCLEINKHMTKIESAGSLPYIYGLSVIYSSASTIISDLIEKDISHLNIIDRLMSQFNFHIKSMNAAISEISFELLRVDDDNPQKSYAELMELDEKLANIEKAIELLPSFLAEKDSKRHKIHALRFYVKSILSENKIYRYADNNIVLDLILRARAHYYAKKAEQSISVVKKAEKKLTSLIDNRMIKTKNAGMITEASLVSLGFQSNYKNEVRQFFQQVISLIEESEEIPDFIVDSAISTFASMTEFNEMLNLILLDTQELLASKVDVSIKGKEVNWDFVKRREMFIPAIIKTFEAVKNVILGELYSKIKKKENKAESCYTDASKAFYEVSEILGKIANYLEDQKELPQFVYTMSLFTRENANAIRDRRKREPVPYFEIVQTLDYLILNL